MLSWLWPSRDWADSERQLVRQFENCHVVRPGLESRLMAHREPGWHACAERILERCPNRIIVLFQYGAVERRTWIGCIKL